METIEKEIEITDDNFHQYFFDVRQNRPKKGQVMACFSAIAALVAGPQKMDLIQLLKSDKAKQAALVMKKIHCAKEPDCYRVCKEICEDMLNGMTDEEIMNKEYEFFLESFYYVERKYIPKNNRHWSTIDLISYDKETKTYKASINI